MSQPDTIVEAISWLLGGLGLFVYGVHILSAGLRQSAGERVRRAVARATRFSLVGLLLGTAITALLQSSSATTVVVVGFVDAGVLSLGQAVGVIFGSGIGSTLTAQLIAGGWLEALALPAIGVGLILHLFVPRRGVRYVGRCVLGFGMVFFGFALMKAAVAQWQSTAIRSWFAYLGEPSPLNMALAVALGAVATAVLQSSAATIGMIMALASEGVIPDLSTALPLVVGCNIGTTVTAVLASIGATVTARRAALLHVLFRLFGGVCTLLLLRYYEQYIPFTAGRVTQQIANFHTIQNLLTALVLVPFGGLFVRVVRWLVPGREETTPAPLYVDFGRKVSPEQAVEQARREILRVAGVVREMTVDAVTALSERSDALLESVMKREEAMDTLHQTVVQFLLSPGSRALHGGTNLDAMALLQVLQHVERVGDHAENLAEIARLRIERVVPLDASMLEGLAGIGSSVDRLAAQLAAELTRPGAADRAEVDRLRVEVKRASQVAIERTRRCVSDGTCLAMAAVIYEDAITNLTSCATHLRKAVRAVRPAGEQW